MDVGCVLAKSTTLCHYFGFETLICDWKKWRGEVMEVLRQCANDDDNVIEREILYELKEIGVDTRRYAKRPAITRLEEEEDKSKCFSRLEKLVDGPMWSLNRTAECLLLFYFTGPEILVLASKFQLPDLVKVAKCRGVSKQVAVAIVIVRLQALRFKWIGRLFQMDRKDISKIAKACFMRILQFRPLLQSPCTHPNRMVIWEKEMLTYITAISNKTGYAIDQIPIHSFWDGTDNIINCPSKYILQKYVDQRVHVDVTWDGHHRVNSLVSLAMVLPNGVGFVSPLFEGRIPDVTMQAETDLEDATVFMSSADPKMFVFHYDAQSRKLPPPPGYKVVMGFGDQGFTLSDRLLRYASDYQLAAYPHLKKFNRAMKGPRVSSEHFFGRTVTLFPIIAIKYFNNVFKNPVDAVINAAYMFTNLHNFFRPNQISQYFDVAPFAIDDYFANFAPPALPAQFIQS